ncbi:zinc finger protein 569-like [Achroia grisella]|uniref:zinc finger protein 569-like n=1 Tax=Achroia grisella TaxID=688607 RepID=UPI0027D23F8C|nr:zinc finger protein 569-like [Achroia grisella]
MFELKACVVCFSTNLKLYSMDNGHLRRDFNTISGLQTCRGNGTPDYLCWQCCGYVTHFLKFRKKCQRANFALQEMLARNNEISKFHLENFNHQAIDIKPSLSYLDTCKTHYEEVKFQWVKNNRINIFKNDKISVIHYNTFPNEERFAFESEMWENNENKNEIVKTETANNISIEFDFNNDFPFQQTDDNEDRDDSFNNDLIASDNDNEEKFVEETQTDRKQTPPKSSVKIDKKNADGLKLDEEYANVYPISKKEAKAAVEVYKMFSTGKHRCDICNKAFFNENRLKVHLRMHDKHVSGPFRCDLCIYYYKTQFLLKTHVTEKHMYKYVCKECPEVNFDRTSAKQHYIWTHLQKGRKKDGNWYDSRPSWLHNKGGKRIKGVVTMRPVRKTTKFPEDYLIYTPVTQEEQYKLVDERKNTRNYLLSKYKCEFCYRGFRETATYNKHMKKHDPAYAGKFQCDMCKLHFRDGRKMYKHMNLTHLFKFSCQMCRYVCYNKGQAQMHYRWHKNVTYECPHCKQEFKKASTRLTHIRIKHPSTYICNLCGHSFVSESGLYCHKKIAHSVEEIALSESTTAADASITKDEKARVGTAVREVNGTGEGAAAAGEVVDNDPRYCAECDIRFLSEAAYTTHLGSSSNHTSTNKSIKSRRMVKSGRRPGRPSGSRKSEIHNIGLPTATNCEVCGKFLVNDVQARKHYESEHPGADYLKRYMCDVCGHTTRQYANLMVHMRTHTHEKPYECPHCDRRFSMPSNRDRHLVVHTGEKRYQCQHCNRRFTQSSAVKLHIQTVHLKIPYAPWDKKNRKRRKELEGTSAPVSTVNTVNAACLLPPPKLLIDNQGDYLNAYITYNV